VLGVYPSVSSSLSGLDVDSQWTGEIDATYFFTRNVALESSITWAKQDVTYNGTSVGALKMMPVDVRAAILLHRPRRVEALHRRRLQLHVFLRKRPGQQRRSVGQ